MHERCPVLCGRARQGTCCAVMCCLGLGCHVAVVGGLTDTALFDAETEHALLLNAPSELPNHGRRRAQRWRSNRSSGWQRYGETSCVHRTRAGRRQEKLHRVSSCRQAALGTVGQGERASESGRYHTHHATTRCIHTPLPTTSCHAISMPCHAAQG